MSRFGYSQQWMPLTSTNTSTYTSPAYAVIEYAAQSVSIQTLNAVTSLFTIQATNVDGSTTSIAEGNWSNVTAITSQGIYTLDPGARWMRVLRSSLESFSTVAASFWGS